jgi:cellulose synthase/poly-beta-1,6-N-acetylglucosamine synthase-like glycosyltransferase
MQDQDVSLHRPKEPLARAAAPFVPAQEWLAFELRPRVSVVVPTCGRLLLLARCLRALAQQRLERRAYEIIVVDDRPGLAATRTLVQEFAATHATGPRVRYLAPLAVFWRLPGALRFRVMFA